MRVGVEDVGRGGAARLVHPHVERCVVPVREPALHLVELQGRDAEVEEDAAGGAVGLLGEDAGDVVVDRVHPDEAVAEAQQPLPGQRQGLDVTVQPDDADGRAAVEQRLGVSPHAEGRVDAHRALDLQGRLEQLDDTVAQHRDVPLGGVSSVAHRGPSRSWRSCGRVRLDPAAGPHPIRARRGGSRVGSGSAGGRRSGRRWGVRTGVWRGWARGAVSHLAGAHSPGTTSSEGTE